MDMGINSQLDMSLRDLDLSRPNRPSRLCIICLMLVMPTEVELEVVLRDQEELGVDVEVLEEVGAGEVGDVVELLSLFRMGSRADC